MKRFPEWFNEEQEHIKTAYSEEFFLACKDRDSVAFHHISKIEYVKARYKEYIDIRDYKEEVFK